MSLRNESPKNVDGVRKPYLFRSYANLHRSNDEAEKSVDRNPGRANGVPIWQVARATTAAPTFFKPMLIHGLEHFDGRFAANNPCLEIYHEVKKVNNNYEKSVNLILSIGTGKHLNGLRGRRFGDCWNYRAERSEEVHEVMMRKRDDSNTSFHYYRLNVDKGLGLLMLDEWRTQGALIRNFGRIIGKRKPRKPGDQPSQAGPSEAVIQETQASVSKHAQPQNGQDLSDVEPTENDIHPLENAQRESSRAGANQPNPAPVIIGQEAEATGRINMESSEKYPDSRKKASIPVWLQPKNSTLETIRMHTVAYLEQDHVKEWLEECAKTLVESRRNRAKSNPQRWKRVCYNAWYTCKVNGCRLNEAMYPQEEDLLRHLRENHADTFRHPDEELEVMFTSRKGVVQ